GRVREVTLNLYAVHFSPSRLPVARSTWTVGRDLPCEIVGNFTRESNQGKNIEGHEGHSGDGTRGVVHPMGGIPGNCAKHRNRNGIGRHAHVKEQLRAVEVIEYQEAKHAQSQSAKREYVQEIGVNSVCDPEQNSSFREPTDRDPVSVQANRNCDRDETDSNGQVQEIKDLRSTGAELSGVHLPAQK